VNAWRWIACVVLFGGIAPLTQAQTGPLRDPTSPISLPTWMRFCTEKELVRLNRSIHGQVIDFTDNHKKDRRLYSNALCEKRDMYVYLPPGYNPDLKYPLMIWMHGFNQDEKNFLDLVPYFDRSMACGDLPTMIIVAPDGSIQGRPTIFRSGSFYLNSLAGKFEDYIVSEVYPFMVDNYPIRPERGAHIFSGASMGGFSAFNLGIKYREHFAIAVGIHPPLNLRYTNCRGNYFGNFDPNCYALREEYRPFASRARFYGLITIRERQLIHPLFDNLPDVMGLIAKENPVEMLDSYNLKPGELSMFVGYGGRDQFNIDAQVESFVYEADKRGIVVTTAKIPRGDHSTATGVKLFPAFNEWIRPLLSEYSPAPSSIVEIKK
jgi:hypothetical protein